MATRRDELNAYSFARRRTVAAFLQPSPHGSEEAAPKPLKTVLPSLGVATLVLVGFGAWGMLQPAAPKGWDADGKNVIVGADSTTRYVLVRTKGEKKRSLHPVLNLASAKLLLKGGNPGVLKISESVLDKSKYPMGATVGIPFAPDRLPSAEDAEKRKYWSVCESPSGSTQDKESRKATYVLNEADYGKLLRNKNELNDRQALYVEGPAVGGRLAPQYMVTSDGRVFQMGGAATALDDEKGMGDLKRAVFGELAKPQKVSAEFIKTLIPGGTVDFPKPELATGNAVVEGLDPKLSRVGLVLEAVSGDHKQKYIVLKDRVAPISDFTAQMWLSSPWSVSLYGGQVPRALPVPPQDIHPVEEQYGAEFNWPEKPVKQANLQETGVNQVSCSIYHGHRDNERQGHPLKMTMWASRTFPKDISQTGSSSYVSPGSGLLFKRITGGEAGGGSVYLVTDTGLRYSVPFRNDSQVTGGDKNADGEQTNTNQARLGYDKTRPVSVPAAWADLLPVGPELTSGNAEQAQGS